VPSDSALLVAGSGAAPLSYEVPNAQEIVTLAARAVVDGSGAASAFLPVVQIISDGGIVLAEAFTDASVAAGASAQVSWFPGVAAAAAASSSAVEEVAYFEWNGGSSGAIPGTRKFDVSLTSSSNSAVFDASGGFARVKASGAIQAYLFVDWGTTETVTAGAITEYRFGLDFPVFPFYTVGGPWKTIPATPSVLVYDTEVTGEFFVSAPTLTMRPFVRAPAMAPGGDPAGMNLVLIKLRDAWTF
jgi:hypothetical protein